MRTLEVQELFIIRILMIIEIIIRGWQCDGYVNLKNRLLNWIIYFNKPDVHFTNALLCCKKRTRKNRDANEFHSRSFFFMRRFHISSSSTCKKECESCRSMSSAWSTMKTNPPLNIIASPNIKVLTILRKKVDSFFWHCLWK